LAVVIAPEQSFVIAPDKVSEWGGADAHRSSYHSNCQRGQRCLERSSSDFAIFLQARRIYLRRIVSRNAATSGCPRSRGEKITGRKIEFTNREMCKVLVDTPVIFAGCRSAIVERYLKSPTGARRWNKGNCRPIPGNAE
jgi:hypothetical protein